MKLLPLVILCTLPFGVHAKDSLQNKLQSAIESKDRKAEEVARDQNRLPQETLKFFGLKEDMSVLDLNPGGGYYVRLLSSILKEKGQLYIALGTDYMEDSMLKEPAHSWVQVTSKKSKIERPKGERYYTLGELDFDIPKVDMITSFRNYHLFSTADRARLNKAIYDALKPGGIYAVIDHTARHGEPPREQNRRRLDPVQAIFEIQAAGFEWVDYSLLHYRPQDDLTLEVGDKSVTGQTDRWTLKFVKPAK